MKEIAIRLYSPEDIYERDEKFRSQLYFDVQINGEVYRNLKKAQFCIEAPKLIKGDCNWSRWEDWDLAMEIEKNFNVSYS